MNVVSPASSSVRTLVPCACNPKVRSIIAKFPNAPEVSLQSTS